MQKDIKTRLIVGVAILVAGIILGLLLWYFVGGAVASLLAFLGIGGGGAISNEALAQHRAETAKALQERDKVAAEKDLILATEWDAEKAEALSLSRRQAARVAQGRAENGRIEEEGRRLSEAEIMEKAEKEALKEMAR